MDERTRHATQAHLLCIVPSTGRAARERWCPKGEARGAGPVLGRRSADWTSGLSRSNLKLRLLATIPNSRPSPPNLAPQSNAVSPAPVCNPGILS